MLKNLIKIAFRSLWKRKLFSFINIIGLSVGISCFFLIMINVRDEFSYDNFHENAENLYRVALERIYPDNVIFYSVIPYSIGDSMMSDFPEVENMTRISKVREEIVFRYQDKTFEEDKIILVEPNFFEIFSIPLFKGDPATIFSTQNSIVLTKDTALKYFGEEDPLGKQLSIPQQDLIVSGVCDNVPQNSHLEFDFLGSISITGLQNQPEYVSFSVHTYVELNDDVSTKQIEEKMPALVERYAAGQIKAQTGISFQEYTAAGNGYNYFLQNIEDIHLHSNLEGEIKPNSNIMYAYILIAIALFLIVIACINFMNLSTAKSATRAREVGIRKIVGSSRGLLIRQFLFESIVISFISLIIAGFLAQFLLPVFNQLARKQLEINYLKDPFNLPLLLSIGLVVGILAGSYPSFVLSSFQPVTVLKGRYTTSRKGIRLRNALVVFQFTISIILISITILVQRQMNFMQRMDLGFDKENMVIVERAFTLQNRGESFKQELRNIPGVIQVSGSNTIVSGGFYYGVMFQSEKDTEVKTTRGMTVDQDFIETLGIEITEGRGFSREFNEERNVIINESAIAEFGWNNPIGMTLKRAGGPNEPTGDYTVVGVVKDFHYNSLHSEVNSFVLFSNFGERRIFGNLNIRIRPENINTTLAAVENKWAEFNSQEPLSYYFLEDKLNDLYKNERTSGQIFGVFSMLAIVIACVGLFGLSSYMAQQRTKEIGIRKVLGSTASKIVVLLSKDFAKLVLLAFVAALPVAYYAISKWLQNFAYRSAIQLWIFLLAGLGAFLVAQFTISFQALKAANTHPADTLRHE